MTPVEYKSGALRAPSNRRSQHGVGLLEVLLTVLLISIGFLAAAKMQVQGMRYSQGAYTQAQAYFMITDMMDRMRGNPEAVEAGLYSNKGTTNNIDDPGCNTNLCSPAQVAAQDLFDWSAMIYPLRNNSKFVPVLPSSDAVQANATITPLANGLFQLRANWIERIGNQDAEQQLILEFAL